MSSQNSSRPPSGTSKAPRLERGKTRVAALVVAGTEVFADRGYDAATMTEIAARAGASIGSLYQFFPTKDLLATAVHESLFEKMLEMLLHIRNDARGKSTAHLINELFSRLFAFLAEHPAFLTLAERRDIDTLRRLATRSRMRSEIAEMLTLSSRPLSTERAAIVSIIMLEMMKSAVALGRSENELVQHAVFAEMRQMLQLCICTAEQ